MVEQFKETGHPVFKSISALSRGILKEKWQMYHSIYGAVSSWCEQFGMRPNEREMTSERFVTKGNEQLLKNVKPQEVNSLVQTPRSFVLFWRRDARHSHPCEDRRDAENAH